MLAREGAWLAAEAVRRAGWAEIVGPVEHRNRKAYPSVYMIAKLCEEMRLHGRLFSVRPPQLSAG